MYQIEIQTTKRTSTASTEALCCRLTESLSSIHAITRLPTVLGLPADTVAELLAPLGINQGDADITHLDALLHTAKVLGVVEEYAITQEPHCLGKPLTVEPVGSEGQSVRVELPSGWLVELDLPGVALANEERTRRKWTSVVTA
jgi:hypothetical protein